VSSFEDRLWSDLVRDHGEQLRAIPAPVAHRRRRPALLTATALAVAGLTAAAIIAFTATTSAPPAYAVTTNPDGTVTVTLNDVSAIATLNARLAHDGIAARAVPLTADCPIHGFPNPMPADTDPSTYTITILPSQIPAGYTEVLAVGERAPGQIQLAQGAFRSPVPVCFNSAPTTIHPIDMSHASPALKAAIARAREAAHAAAQGPER
jgi:hypothetical protein